MRRPRGARCGSPTDANYPTKPVRLIVPFSPGGPNDVLGRMIATHLTEVLGKTVIVDNRTGAEGIIGTEIAVMAVPDGCTLLVTADPTITINPSVYLKPPYNAIRDLPAITQLIGCAYVVVLHPSVAAAPGAPELRLSFFCLSASSQQAVINF